MERVEAIARARGATDCRVSTSDAERMAFWAGRKAASPRRSHFAGLLLHGRHDPPQRNCPRSLPGCASFPSVTGLQVANVFHAGDGNLHPLILYDANKPGELDAAEAFGADILRLCVEVGGVLTGEHGVGVEKRDLMPTMSPKPTSPTRSG